MFVRNYFLYFTWLLATIGTVVSLYYSEILHLDPCHLCWLQRTALFPLVIILGIACFRGALYIASYVLPQVVIGLLLSLYQIAIQEIPGFNPIEICGAGPSCSEKVLIGLGFITLPMLCAGLFLALTILLSILWGASRRLEKERNNRKS